MFTDRNTHVPTPLTRGPQQVDSAGPRKGEYLVLLERQMEGMNLHFKSLSVRREEELS